MLAAGFLYWATKTPLYKTDAEDWRSQLLSSNDPSISSLEPSYDNNYWAANVVLYHATGDKMYLQVSVFLPAMAMCLSHAVSYAIHDMDWQ